MGKAFVVPNADYSAKNLGRVTPTGTVPIEEITIKGASSVNTFGKFSATISPIFSTQRGLIWSIESGASYAEIDQNGNLTVLPGTSSAAVTIKCESSSNSDVFATKQVTVTAGAIVYYDYITTDGTDFVVMPGLSMKYNSTLTARLTLGNANEYTFLAKNGTQPTLGCYCSNTNKASAAIGGGVPKFTDRDGSIVYRYVFTTSSVANASDASIYLYNDKTDAFLGSETAQKCYINSAFFIFRWGECAPNATPSYNAPANTPAGARFYGVTVVDGSSTTIAQYKPCTYNGVPGLYDTVANIFRGGFLGTNGITAGNE